MSHADRISQQYNSRKDADLTFIVRCMTDEIDMRIMEFVRTYDPSDVTCMPHVFPSRLERWAHIIQQVATKHEDPVVALESSVAALSNWTHECKSALEFDWDYQSSIYIGDTDTPTKVSMFEQEKYLYTKRGISNPETALPEAINLQKAHGLQARDTAVSTFCKLARQYPAEALAALNRLPQNESDHLNSSLADALDLQAFKAELSASVPPGYTPKTKKPVLQREQPFF